MGTAFIGMHLKYDIDSDGVRNFNVSDLEKSEKF